MKDFSAKNQGGCLPPSACGLTPRGYFCREDFGIGGHPGGDGGGFGGACGADDRGVAGAAAEVAGKGGVVVLVAVQMGHGHRDDETGGAKAAL